jgi:transketolase
MKLEKNQKYLLNNLSDCIRILAADAVETANSGHPGMPLGMADVMTVLAFEFLRFNPKDSSWPARDRLVLSAGHGSMLLYSFFYLAGYTGFSLEDIKKFRQLSSKAAGHPEHGIFDAIETTSGPLGQGFANAVGMAIAEKKYKARVGEEISDYKIYTIVGDGCLMEGISYEAASLAGHLKLDNLVVIFDDNGISIDGKTSLTISENHEQKFLALGFNVFRSDGYDHEQIRTALQKTRTSDKPSFIICSTTIGKGAKIKAGTEHAHGSPLGIDEITYLKSNIEFAGDSFFIPDDLKKLWESSWLKSESEYNSWQSNYNSLNSEDKIFLNQTQNNLILENIEYPSKPEATRVSSGKLLCELLKYNNKIIIGSADLSSSNNLFNNLSNPITADDFSGNFIHYGIREHAMAAIMNGLALSGFSAIGGTFFVFSDYMRPAIRLAAIMNLPVIYIMTHDSIGVGEDGPTHQPVEQLSSLRAMPNLTLFRPADFVETLECYKVISEKKTGPSMMVLSRQALPQIREYAPLENKSSRGAYIISEAKNLDQIDVVLFASGSELQIALEVQKTLEITEKSIRVISIPSFELLEQQEKGYLSSLKGGAKLAAGIEAGSEFGWHKIIGCDGMFFGINDFGKSCPAEELFSYFDLTAKSIAEKIIKRLIPLPSKLTEQYNY